MRHHTVFLPLLFPLLLAACANTGTNKGNVNITTVENDQMIAGVACIVTNRAQRWEITTPETLAVGAADGELHVLCSKDGYRTSELRILPAGASPSGPSIGLGLGGSTGGIGSAVGAGLGLSLPFGGSSRGGDYPSSITVTMTQE